MFDKNFNSPSVKVSLHPKQMENKLTSAGKTLGILGALAPTVAQGADIDQLKAQFQQQLAQAPESVTKVLQSGEGCDVSLLNDAMASNDYTEYMACGEIAKLKAEIGLAGIEQALINEQALLKDDSEALADRKVTKAELAQGNQRLDDEDKVNKTTIEVLTKEIAANNKILAARMVQN